MWGEMPPAPSRLTPAHLNKGGPMAIDAATVRRVAKLARIAEPGGPAGAARLRVVLDHELDRAARTRWTWRACSR